MNYEFFADKVDKINLLDFIFKETDLRIYDFASPYGEEIAEYKTSDEIVKKFDLDNGRQTFNMWSPRVAGEILFRRIQLDPKSCNGHSFRYSTDGWGLIQLYFEGQRENALHYSHIGHFDEKGALRKETTNKFNGNANQWNWKEIEQTSRKLKNYLHTKIAVRKIGSHGILPGAESQNKKGIKS